MKLSIFLSLLFALFLWHFVGQERFFYVWDKQVYHDLAREALARFRIGPGEGLRYLRATTAQDYNALFTLPLLPVMAVFGQGRTVFLLAVYAVYFLPFALMFSRLATRNLVPGTSRTSIFLLILITPPTWAALLHGMPDISGVLLMAGALGIYLSAPAPLPWKKAAAVGVLLGAAFLFRRHFAYASLAFLAAASLEGLMLRSRASLFSLVAMGLSCLAVIALVAPDFLHKTATTDYNALYASYHATPLALLRYYTERFGLLPWALALMGLYLGLTRNIFEGRAARFIVIAALCWCVVWVAVVKDTNRQYTLHWLLPLYLTGMTGLLAALPKKAKAALLVFLSFNFLHATFHHPLERRLDGILLAAPYRPLQREDYAEVERLVAFLRDTVKPEEPILVAASSQVLNDSILHSAEQRLYPQAHLHVLPCGMVDSRDTCPVAALMQANYVLVATPPQRHLAEEAQRSVGALVGLFTGDHPVARDFKKLSGSFSLSENGITRPEILKRPPGPVTVEIYRRIRASSPEAEKEADEVLAQALH